MTHLVINVREEARLAAENFKELERLSKRLHGVSMLRYMEMKQDQRWLYKLKKSFNKTRDKDTRLELRLSMSRLKQDIAAVLLESNQYKKAFTAYEILSWRENGVTRYNGTARALIGMGHLEAARRLLAKGLKRFPKAVALIITQGIFHQCSGDHMNAINFFEQALECDPRNEFTLFDKAVSLGEIGQNKKALAILRKLFRKYPGDIKIAELIEQIECKAGNK